MYRTGSAWLDLPSCPSTDPTPLSSSRALSPALPSSLVPWRRGAPHLRRKHTTHHTKNRRRRPKVSMAQPADPLEFPIPKLYRNSSSSCSCWRIRIQSRTAPGKGLPPRAYFFNLGVVDPAPERNLRPLPRIGAPWTPQRERPAARAPGKQQRQREQ